MALEIQSLAHVNSLFWIKSLDGGGEEGSTRRVLEDLEPFLQSHNVPFEVVTPTSSAHLLQILAHIEKLAKDGAKPMIHFDTHGNSQHGLYIADSQEFLGWDKLADSLRQINVATGNNLCVISAACFGFHLTKQSTITKPTMFYLLIAPPDTISFGFAEKALFPFYRQVFQTSEIIDAYKMHLSSSMELFHSEKLLLVGMMRYFSEECMGPRADERLEDMVSLATSVIGQTDPVALQKARTLAKELVTPSNKIFQRYAGIFLLGKSPSITFDEIMRFIEIGKSQA